MKGSVKRTILLISITHICILLVYALIYVIIDFKYPNSFGDDNVMTIANAMFVSANTHTTVGYGDVSPKTDIAKMACTSHTLLVFFLTILDSSMLNSMAKNISRLMTFTIY
jgi:hypothetical protein